MTNKSAAGSAAKSGTGLLGKSTPSVARNSMSGKVGKSSSFFGSSGKNSKTQSYSDKTGSFFGSSTKSSYSGLIGSSKNVSDKHNYLDSKKSVNLIDTNKNSNNYKTAVGASVKNTNVLYGKDNRNLGSPEKSYEKSYGFSSSSKSPKTSEPSRDYPSFVTPKSNKQSSAFGVLWLPMRKRNKKKDVVYSSHNYDSYKSRSPSVYNFMSGNSSDHQSQKENEDAKLLVPEPPKVVSLAVNTGITAAAIDVPADSSSNVNLEEKLKFIQQDSEDNKETAIKSNDTDEQNDKDKKKDEGYLEYEDTSEKTSELKIDGQKQGDNAGAPSPRKTATDNPNNKEEDCGVQCLYYILQCCDCVLM